MAIETLGPIGQSGTELSRTAQKFFNGKKVGQLTVQPNVKPTPLPKLEKPNATDQIVKRSEAQLQIPDARETRQVNFNTQELILSRAEERRNAGKEGIIGINIDIQV